MKRFGLIFGLFFLCVELAFSQNWFVGGSANLRFDGVENKDASLQRNYGGTLNPEIGYKFDKYDFGGNLIFRSDFQYSEDKNGFATGTRSLGAGIGVFWRYKFITFFDKLSILGRFDANYVFSTLINNPGSYPRDYKHESGFGISPVIEYKLTDRLSLYSSIIGSIIRISSSYDKSYSSDQDYIDGRSTNRYSFSLTLPSEYSFSLTNISFGFYMTF
jgi:hypothetical protein